jgi:uncharacterized repeat protein (TIGR01451 family)
MTSRCVRAGRLRVGIAVVGLALAWGPRLPAQAVTQVGCDAGGLIAAVSDANADPDADILELAPGCVYTLTAAADARGNGLSAITTPVTIHGNGATIARAASAPDFRFFEVFPAASLALDHLTLQNGSFGAIDNSNGTVTVSDSTLSDNSGGQGGGIANFGAAATLTVVRSTLSDNRSREGGAIFNVGGTVTVSDSTLSGNVADDGDGGAILNSDGLGDEGILTVSRSILSGNSALGNGLGGAIANSVLATGFGGTTTVSQSTLSGNTALHGGGGISNSGGGTLTVTQSTLSMNTVNFGSGGGIFTEAGTAVIVSQSTLSGNESSGGGAILNNDGTVTLSGTILANSIVSPGGGNCDGGGGEPFSDAGFNLDDGASCDFTDPTSMSNANDGLEALQRNGGPTPTMALLPDSDAIDAGATAAQGCTGTDQRGVPRPQGAACDIGAYESGDLGVQKTASPNPARPGKELTYAIQVIAAGPVDPTGVVVTDTVPAGTKFGSVTTTQGSCSVSGPTVTCHLGQLPAATTATITVVVKVTAKPGSTLTNQATVSAASGNPDPTNDTAVVAVPVAKK